MYLDICVDVYVLYFERPKDIPGADEIYPGTLAG